MLTLASLHVSTNDIWGSVLHPDSHRAAETSPLQLLFPCFPYLSSSRWAQCYCKGKTHTWTKHRVLHTFQLLHEASHKEALTRVIISGKGKSSFLADV